MDLEQMWQNLSQCDKGANEQNLGGNGVGECEKVSTIDQIDKFIKKKVKKEKKTE